MVRGEVEETDLEGGEVEGVLSDVVRGEGSDEVVDVGHGGEVKGTRSKGTAYKGLQGKGYHSSYRSIQ